MKCPYILREMNRVHEELVTRGTIETRRFRQYVDAFGSDFKETVSKRAVHWLDLGAGYAYPQRALLSGDAGINNPSLEATALGLLTPDDGDYGRFKNVLETKGKTHQFKYVAKPFDEVEQKEIKPASVATDLLGILSYSRHFDQDLSKAMNMLEKEGKLYLLLSDPLETLRFYHRDGTEVPLEKYLEQVKGIKVAEYQPVLLDGRILYRTVLQKTAETVTAPALEVKGFMAEGPPLRSYWLPE